VSPLVRALREDGLSLAEIPEEVDGCGTCFAVASRGTRCKVSRVLEARERRF